MTGQHGFSDNDDRALLRSLESGATRQLLDRTALIERAMVRMFVLLTQLGDRIMSALDDLAAEVAKVEAVEASAVVLIEGIVAELKAAQNDPALVAPLIARLEAATAPLAAAVAANPLNPAPTPTPAPAPVEPTPPA